MAALNDLEAKYAEHYLRIHRNAIVARWAIRALEKHYDAEEGEGWAVRLQGWRSCCRCRAASWPRCAA